ncbi:Na+/H+ antiporter subunit E [Saccharomonospora sp.]|uniref:Na+/H+ antiporter subunit E n=1 Tax=Saccharomonospora sp. TaxID=33913 RepID=UPI002611BB14|nr:Na+/H+ antiporter subunit E [Saccharomonospora sp.]
MAGLFARIAALTAIYLLALGNIHPGDILDGVVLAVILVIGGRFVLSLRSAEGPPPAVSVPRRLAGVPALLGGTLVDIARGSWTVARYCLRPPAEAEPGIVTVPIGRSSPGSATAWGIRVGIAPDSVVVGVDEQQGHMLVHVLDARDPEAVRVTQLDGYERRQRRVFP